MMIEELIFTSAKRGLQIGRSGFCTVASTHGMAANLARLLESLSGYRHLYSPGTPGAQKNPVIYSHLKANVGGLAIHVLSRVCDAGFDYSNRTNKLAHHLAIRDPKSQSLGPANALAHASHFYSSWDRAPGKIDPRPLSGKHQPPSVCSTWRTVSGDAGWAGDLIEAVQKRRQVYLIVNESTPSLTLIQEALALLPIHKQWGVTFSTFFTKLPPKIECNIRCVMAGSPEVAVARRSQANLILDLTEHAGQASSKLADMARNGKLIGDSGGLKKVPSNLGPSTPEPNEAPQLTKTKFEAAKPKYSVHHDIEDEEEYDLAEIPPRLRGGRNPETELPPKDQDQRSGNQMGVWIAIAIAILFLAGLSSLLFLPGTRDSISSLLQQTTNFESSLPDEEPSEAHKTKQEQVTKSASEKEHNVILTDLTTLLKDAKELKERFSQFEKEYHTCLEKVDHFTSKLCQIDINEFQNQISDIASKSFKHKIERAGFWDDVKSKVISRLTSHVKKRIPNERQELQAEGQKLNKQLQGILEQNDHILESHKKSQLRRSETGSRESTELSVKLKEITDQLPRSADSQNFEFLSIPEENEILNNVKEAIKLNAEQYISDFKELCLHQDKIEVVPHNNHFYQMGTSEKFVIANIKTTTTPVFFDIRLNLRQANWVAKSNKEEAPNFESTNSGSWINRISHDRWEVIPTDIGRIGEIYFENNQLVYARDSEDVLKEKGYELKGQGAYMLPDANLEISWPTSKAATQIRLGPPERSFKKLTIPPDEEAANRRRPLFNNSKNLKWLTKKTIDELSDFKIEFQPREILGITFTFPSPEIRFQQHDGQVKFTWHLDSSGTIVIKDSRTNDIEDSRTDKISFNEKDFDRPNFQPFIDQLKNEIKELEDEEEEKLENLISNINSACEQIGKTKFGDLLEEGLVGQPMTITDGQNSITVFFFHPETSQAKALEVMDNHFDTLANQSESPKEPRDKVNVPHSESKMPQPLQTEVK